MKRPFASSRPIGPIFLFSSNNNDSYRRVERRLSRWGAKDIDISYINNSVFIDFDTPMPGEQKIKSTLELRSEDVLGGIVRYGVLDKDFSIRHPSNDKDAIERFKQAVSEHNDMLELPHSVDFGDTDKARPHIVMGNAFNELKNDGRLKDFQIVSETGEETQNINAVIDFLVRVDDDILEEFQGEWSHIR